jgi:hypothetical protein
MSTEDRVERWTPGQHLQAIHKACFSGGGWIDPLEWSDYDEAGHAKWEAFAESISRGIAKAAAAPALYEALLQLHTECLEAQAEDDLNLIQSQTLNAARAAIRQALSLARGEGGKDV